MSSEHVDGEVQRRHDRLREEYGGFEEAVVRIEIDPEEASQEYVGGAYVWLTRSDGEAPDLTESMPAWAEDDGERVLLILGRGSDHWGTPGGGIEGYRPGDPGSGETAEEAARREAREEVGIEISIDDCILVETLEWVGPDGEVLSRSLHPLFAASYEGGTIEIQGGELNGAAWFREAPRKVHPMIGDLASDFFGEPVTVGESAGVRLEDATLADRTDG